MKPSRIKVIIFSVYLTFIYISFQNCGNAKNVQADGKVNLIDEDLPGNDLFLNNSIIVRSFDNALGTQDAQDGIDFNSLSNFFNILIENSIFIFNRLNDNFIPSNAIVKYLCLTIEGNNQLEAIFYQNPENLNSYFLKLYFFENSESYSSSEISNVALDSNSLSHQNGSINIQLGELNNNLTFKGSPTSLFINLSTYDSENNVSNVNLNDSDGSLSTCYKF